MPNPHLGYKHNLWTNSKTRKVRVAPHFFYFNKRTLYRRICDLIISGWTEFWLKKRNVTEWQSSAIQLLFQTFQLTFSWRNSTVYLLNIFLFYESSTSSFEKSKNLYKMHINSNFFTKYLSSMVSSLISE